MKTALGESQSTLEHAYCRMANAVNRSRTSEQCKVGDEVFSVQPILGAATHIYQRSLGIGRLDTSQSVKWYRQWPTMGAVKALVLEAVFEYLKSRNATPLSVAPSGDWTVSGGVW